MLFKKKKKSVHIFSERKIFLGRDSGQMTVTKNEMGIHFPVSNQWPQSSQAWADLPMALGIFF